MEGFSLFSPLWLRNFDSGVPDLKPMCPTPTLNHPDTPLLPTLFFTSQTSTTPFTQEPLVLNPIQFPTSTDRYHLDSINPAMVHCDQSEDDDSHLLSAGRRPKEYVLKTFTGNHTDLFSNTKSGSKDDNTDNPYFHFGKKVHWKRLGFGTMGSAFFAWNMINNSLV